MVNKTTKIAAARVFQSLMIAVAIISLIFTIVGLQPCSGETCMVRLLAYMAAPFLIGSIVLFSIARQVINHFDEEPLTPNQDILDADE